MCIRRNTFCITASLLFTFQTSLPLFCGLSLLRTACLLYHFVLTLSSIFFNFFQNLSTSFSLPSSDTTMSVYHTLSLLSSTFFYFLTALSVSLFDSLDSISSYSPFVNTFLQSFFIFLYTPFLLPYIVFLFYFLILCLTDKFAILIYERNTTHIFLIHT